MQVILQATHGVVSGAPDFFKKAFGDTEDEFINILRLPHKFIFNRDWYEMYEGRAEYDEFMSEFNKLSEDEIIKGEGTGYVTAKEIENEISELTEDGSPYWQKTHPNHQKTVDRVFKLREQLNG